MSSNSTYHTPRTLRKVSQLVQAGLVPPDHRPALEQVAERYHISVPENLAALMVPGDPHDPLHRQFVPSAAELSGRAGELPDPIGDDCKSPVAGLVHRYPDRVLLKPILVCPVYCRFCFRRASVGDAGATLGPDQVAAAMAYIAAHGQIREVILTGGDPLMLPPAALAQLCRDLCAIPHVQVIRWHSRVPIAAPQRITAELAAVLAQPFDHGKAVWLSLHSNHARELAPAAQQAIHHLRRAGIALVAQTVLLRGVNDDADTLETLFRALIRLGVKPYYLHHPDLAPGTGHFRLDIGRGQDIVRQLRGRLTGIAQPTYVLDIPGGAGKSPLTPGYWDADHCQIVDWQDRVHAYRDE